MRPAVLCVVGLQVISLAASTLLVDSLHKREKFAEDIGRVLKRKFYPFSGAGADKWGSHLTRRNEEEKRKFYPFSGAAADKWGSHLKRRDEKRKFYPFSGSAADKWGSHLKRSMKRKFYPFSGSAADKWGSHLKRAI